MGASASTMLSSGEFICLRVAIARSSGRNCALAAPGGSNQSEFICQGRDRLLVCTCNSVSRVSSILVLFHAYTVQGLRFCFWYTLQYFEGNFRSLAVFCYALLNWNHRMQATLKSSLPNFDSFEIPVPMLLASVSSLILSTLFSAVPEISRRYSSSWSHANQRSLFSTKAVPPVHFCPSVQKKLLCLRKPTFTRLDPHWGSTL